MTSKRPTLASSGSINAPHSAQCTVHRGLFITGGLLHATYNTVKS